MQEEVTVRLSLCQRFQNYHKILPHLRWQRDVVVIEPVIDDVEVANASPAADLPYMGSDQVFQAVET